MKYLLDTHTWVWWNMRPEQLSKQVMDTITDIKGYDELLLSAISPWEFFRLVEKKRLGIGCDPEEWMDIAFQMPKLRLVPITPKIAFKSCSLPQPFYDDPADQMIVATAREENATILSRDEKIQNYPYVKTLW